MAHSGLFIMSIMTHLILQDLHIFASIERGQIRTRVDDWHSVSGVRDLLLH